MMPAAGQRGALVGFDDGPVDPEPDEAARAQIVQQLGEFTLALAHERGQHDHARLRRAGQRPIDHLRHAVRAERALGVVRTVRLARAREQQTQVVVDLGHGSHGGSRVVAAGLLVDRDRRRQALDPVHIGLLHQLQELPRIRRQRLDVAALSLGVQSVERERAFAGAREPGDHDQPVARQVKIDIFQVVGARTAHPDAVHWRDRCGQRRANQPL